MTSKEELHAELDRLLVYQHRRRDLSIAGHALIELGLLNEVRCAYEECIMDSDEFDPFETGRIRLRKTISLDHVIPVFMGGSDHPGNLRLIHFGCNASRGAKDYWSQPAARAMQVERLADRWKDPEYRAQMIAVSSSPEKSEKQRKSMLAHWSDPERAARHAATFRREQA